MQGYILVCIWTFSWFSGHSAQHRQWSLFPGHTEHNKGRLSIYSFYVSPSGPVTSNEYMIMFTIIYISYLSYGMISMSFATIIYGEHTILYDMSMVIQIYMNTIYSECIRDCTTRGKYPLAHASVLYTCIINSFSGQISLFAYDSFQSSLPSMALEGDSKTQLYFSTTLHSM